MVLVALVEGRKGDGLYKGRGRGNRQAGAGAAPLPPSERSGRRMGGCAGACAPELDGVQLRWRETVVHLSGSRLRPQGCGPLRTWTLLPVPPLLRSRLREPTE